MTEKHLQCPETTPSSAEDDVADLYERFRAAEYRKVPLRVDPLAVKIEWRDLERDVLRPSLLERFRRWALSWSAASVFASLVVPVMVILGVTLALNAMPPQPLPSRIVIFAAAAIAVVLMALWVVVSISSWKHVSPAERERFYAFGATSVVVCVVGAIAPVAVRHFWPRSPLPSITAADAYTGRGAVLLTQKRYDEAAWALSRASRETASTESPADRAMTVAKLIKGQMYDMTDSAEIRKLAREALEHARRAAQLAPDRADVWNMLAELYVIDGQDAAAEDALRRARAAKIIRPGDLTNTQVIAAHLASRAVALRAETADPAEKKQLEKKVEAAINDLARAEKQSNPIADEALAELHLAHAAVASTAREREASEKEAVTRFIESRSRTTWAVRGQNIVPERNPASAQTAFDPRTGTY